MPIDIAITNDTKKISEKMKQASQGESRTTPNLATKENKDAELTIIYPKSMPSYLRIDKDVKSALMHVARLSREYATFNIEELEWKMQRKLEMELDRQSNLYKAHKQEVMKSLSNVEDLLE